MDNPGGFKINSRDFIKQDWNYSFNGKAFALHVLELLTQLIPVSIAPRHY